MHHAPNSHVDHCCMVIKLKLHSINQIRQQAKTIDLQKLQLNESPAAKNTTCNVSLISAHTVDCVSAGLTVKVVHLSLVEKQKIRLNDLKSFLIISSPRMHRYSVLTRCLNLMFSVFCLWKNKQLSLFYLETDKSLF